MLEAEEALFPYLCVASELVKVETGFVVRTVLVNDLIFEPDCFCHFFPLFHDGLSYLYFPCEFFSSFCQEMGLTQST